MKKRLILIGESGVGKSSILAAWANRDFLEERQSTIGVDFISRHNTNIFDSAGQLRFRPIVNAYLKKVDGIILVYSVDDADSFYKLTDWIDEKNKNLIIVGNKTDKVLTREITYTEAKSFANKYGLLYLETSAKDDSGIDEVFILAKTLICKSPEEPEQYLETIEEPEKKCFLFNLLWCK